MRKLRYVEVKWFDQVYIASKYQSLSWNSCILKPESLLQISSYETEEEVSK